MLEQVVNTIERFGMLPERSRVGVAVSGGADSVALLHILAALSHRSSLELEVLHFNHQLRGKEADLDEAFVRDLAREFGLEFASGRATIGRIARESGDNLEQTARHERYRFFRDVLGDRKLDRIALGHTRSDQAETVLFRLLRGTGSLGMAAIRPLTREGFVRPLIGVSRKDIQAWLNERGVVWREDATNQDLRFARNRLRNQLLPLLARDWNPSIEETLARMALVAYEEEAYWESEIGGLAATLATETPFGMITSAVSLAALHPAVGRRFIRRLIETTRGDLRGLDSAHVEQILALARSNKGDGRVEVPAAAVERSFDKLRFASPGDAGKAASYWFLLDPPARQAIPGAGSTLYLAIRPAGANRGYNKTERDELDWPKIRGSIVLRNWTPGDRLRPVGHSRQKKLKELFQEQRIPSWERPCWPVLVKDDTIIWTRAFGASSEFAAEPGSHEVMSVHESEQERSR